MTTILACRWERDSIVALLERGATVILLIDEWEAAHRSIDEDVIDRTRLMVVPSFDMMDELSVLAAGLQEEGLHIDRVVATEERGQLGAAYLATLLGVPGPSIAQSVRVRDKRAMKLALRGTDVPHAAFATVPNLPPADAAERVQQTVGFPAVVKPVAGMGTNATVRVDSVDELTPWLDENAASGPFVAEQFIPGEEFHVDAVWRNGEFWELAVCRYLQPCIEVTHPGHLNGSTLLPREDHLLLYEEIERLHGALREAFEVVDGITHAEFFRTPDGRIWFSEIALRCGGGGAMEIHKTRGADLRKIWAEALVDGVRITPALGRGADDHPTAMLIAPGASGVIVREPTDEEISAFPWIVDVTRTGRVGDTVRLHALTAGLTLVISGETEEQIRERALELEAALTFDVKAPEE